MVLVGLKRFSLRGLFKAYIALFINVYKMNGLKFIEDHGAAFKNIFWRN